MLCATHTSAWQYRAEPWIVPEKLFDTIHAPGVCFVNVKKNYTFIRGVACIFFYLSLLCLVSSYPTLDRCKNGARRVFSTPFSYRHFNIVRPSHMLSGSLSARSSPVQRCPLCTVNFCSRSFYLYDVLENVPLCILSHTTRPN